MSANRIFSSQLIRTVSASGKVVKVKYTTQTESWDRTYLATHVQDDFSNAVEKTDIPEGATVAILA
jgi:hypothetical protein